MCSSIGAIDKAFVLKLNDFADTFKNNFGNLFEQRSLTYLRWNNTTRGSECCSSLDIRLKYRIITGVVVGAVTGVQCNCGSCGHVSG